MSNVIPYCVFCKKTNAQLKLFSEDNLNKCRYVFTIRKANNLAGHDTVLPTQPNNFQLYHSECYRRYTALPPKYRKRRTTSEDTPSSTLPNSSQSDENEWAIIELQGDVRTTHSPDGSHYIGDLHFMKDGTPALIIGNNLLMGKESKFDKPLAVLEKLVNIDNEIEYVVKAIIRKKLLFKTRPKPVDKE